MDDEDFAETKISSCRIHINGKALRSKAILEREHRALLDEGWLVKGTDYSAILVHELGHQLHSIYHIDTVKLAMKVSGLKVIIELEDYLIKNISEYSVSNIDIGKKYYPRYLRIIIVI